MTISVQKRQGQAREIFRISPVAVGCTLLMLASGAYAQQAAATLETVTVTGIRKGIEDAISVKKNADSIVEAISAEDIGKLPDASVAESIARLPGVTAQREKASGKAALVSVRGMSPDFNGGLLNGREQASTGDSRGVRFDEFPAELLGSVVIYKTPDGALIGQGLASTIDMKTVRPLDFGKRQVVVNYRKEKSGVGNDGGTGTGNRQSLSYIDQFADRTIGVALGLTRTENNGAPQNSFNSWGGWKANVTGTSTTGATVTGDAPGGFGNDSSQNTSKRDGLMAVFQFKPNKDFETQVDFFKSTGESKLKITGLEGSVGGRVGGAFGFGVINPVGTLINATVSNGVVTSGTVTGYSGDIRNHINSSTDELNSVGWNTKFKVKEWTAMADISQSKTVVDSPRLETTAGLPGNAAAYGNISWTGFNGSNFADVKYSTSLNYSDRAVAKLTDVDGWSGGLSSPQAGYYADPHVTDKINAYRFSAKRDLSVGPIVNLDLGFNYSDRQKTRTTQEGRLVIAGNAPYASVAMPGTATAVAGATGIPIAVWDPSGSVGSVYQVADKVDQYILLKDWAVTEKVSTLFAKGDLDGEMFGRHYHGNVGAQYVRTSQSSSGFNIDTSTCTGNTAATCPAKTIVKGSDYSDLLPSLNVGFDMGNDQIMRIAAGKVLSRADMGDMANNLSFGVDANNGKPILKGGGGNPLLQPFRAKAFDLSYEKYFGVKGYLSVAGFYKSLDTYILKVPNAYDFKPYVGSTTVLPTGGSTLGIMTQPSNGNGGSIKGVEFAVNIPFSLIAKPLDGFGALLNYSNVSSSVTLPASGFSTDSVGTTNVPLPGMSKQVTNLRLYYEKAGFQIAAAARKRSDFLGQISDFQDNRQLTYIKGETIVDLQASYQFQSGPAKGLSILLQGSNLTNAAFQQYSTSPSTITSKTTFGKSYLFGANYKF